MKKITLLILLISCFSFSQNEFSYTEEGLNPKYLVVSNDSLDETQLYRKTLKWVKNTFKNPDEVIDTQIENDMIRITGIETDVVTVGSLLFDLKYTIKISFKEGKYKFEPITLSCKADSIYSTGWIDFSSIDGTPYFKNGKAISKFESYVIDIPKNLNALNNSLNTFLNAPEDDW